MSIKKIISTAAGLSLAALTMITPAEAADESSPLYKWVNNETGYDTSQPVPYSPHGDSTQVYIPDEYIQEKEQFRSSWVGTIYNLHFGQSSNETEFRSAYDEVLQNFIDSNLNAIIFQIRPEQDAWYPSEEGNPWSKYLTTSGKEGTDPGYDPLAIMVEETHQAGLEYHAWFNPYRVTNRKVSLLSADDKATIENLGYSINDVLNGSVADHVRIYTEAGLLAENNFAVQHPEWVMRQDEKLFLNPGIPQVQQHIVATISEVARNYDVDAIHFDDYFYPDGFGSANLDPTTAQDAQTFAEYSGDFPTTSQGLEDWRRANTTALVTKVKEALNQINAEENRSVQFGISPAGIWDHASNTSLGSLTPSTSMSSFRRIYADTYTWVKDELIDYVLPQIYWAFSTSAAPYGELARWWNNVAEGTHVQVYVGHANYKSANSTGVGEWTNPEEIGNQIKFNQTLNNIYGSAFYSYNDILKSDNDVKNQSIDIVNGYFSSIALVPAKPWLSSTEIAAPGEVTDEGKTITWSNNDTDNSRFFIVYMGQGNIEEIISQPENIQARLWAGKNEQFTYEKTSSAGQDTSASTSETYVVTAVDAAGVESPGVLAQVKNDSTPTPGASESSTPGGETTGPSTAAPTTPATNASPSNHADEGTSGKNTSLASTGVRTIPTVLAIILLVGGTVLVGIRRRSA